MFTDRKMSDENFQMLHFYKITCLNLLLYHKFSKNPYPWFQNYRYDHKWHFGSVNCILIFWQPFVRQIHSHLCPTRYVCSVKKRRASFWPTNLHPWKLQNNSQTTHRFLSCTQFQWCKGNSMWIIEAVLISNKVSCFGIELFATHLVTDNGSCFLRLLCFLWG